MSKRVKKIMKKMKKRINNPKYGHFHIRKSLVIWLLWSCGILLASTFGNAYADHNSFLQSKLTQHYQQNTLETKSQDMMSEVLKTIESVQKLEVKYIEIVNEEGNKFGKSAGAPVWLDSNLTSPFHLYQFFMRLPDNQIR